jgi:hypothetical protein
MGLMCSMLGGSQKCISNLCWKSSWESKSLGCVTVSDQGSLYTMEFFLHMQLFYIYFSHLLFLIL